MYVREPKQKRQNTSNRFDTTVTQRKRRRQFGVNPFNPDRGITRNSFLANRSNNPYTKNNTGMPDELKTGIENLSGFSMDDVNVHYNSTLPDKLDAHAYTRGTDIHLAPGREQHLPHEAWHVVQQKQRRVNPTMRMMGKNINDSPGLEGEADRMSTKALQQRGTAGGELKNASPAGEGNSSVAQLMRKLIGQVKKGDQYLDAWWDSDDGKYYNSKTDGRLLRPQPNSYRYYAEGPGTHAYNIAKEKEGILVKATEFLPEDDLKADPNWETQYNAVVADIPPNFKFKLGEASGDVLTKTKHRTVKRTSALTREKMAREHDLIQLTFPRGFIRLGQGQDGLAAEQDAKIVEGFLRTAVLRVKRGGKIQVVLMDQDFYNNYMEQHVLPKLNDIGVRWVHQLEPEKAALSGSYHDKREFTKPKKHTPAPELQYRHRKTQSADVLTSKTGRDKIWVFEKK